MSKLTSTFGSRRLVLTPTLRKASARSSYAMVCFSILFVFTTSLHLFLESIRVIKAAPQPSDESSSESSNEGFGERE